MFDWVTLLSVLLPVAIAASAFVLLLCLRPEKFTQVRINLLWLSTLVAILTLVFGLRLIELVMNPPAGKDTNTVEIVLSSLVGVGIGGLIAIAGQLVQDQGQDSQGNRPRTLTGRQTRRKVNDADIINGADRQVRRKPMGRC